MIVEEKCPVCGSTQFEIVEYDTEASDDYMDDWIRCVCSNNHAFYIDRIYELRTVNIYPDDEEE